jgi:hypothetical protein
MFLMNQQINSDYSPKSINRLVFVMEMRYVSFEVGSEVLSIYMDFILQICTYCEQYNLMLGYVVLFSNTFFFHSQCAEC